MSITGLPGHSHAKGVEIMSEEKGFFLKTTEFIGWFKNMIRDIVICPSKIRVITVGVWRGGVIVVFRCGEKLYIAKVRGGIKVSMYGYRTAKGNITKIETVELPDNEDNAIMLYREALFHVYGGVDFDIYR
jgi:hypothetical protein